ncbi:hypothetical protein KGA66_16795 [Actinocrinis puniceicyclus]|uniref:Uncharacterized protein n=1 Tax=Actinocrinis puniceicyclus TaxID=977794 RepID=A0A8J8BCZ4_9ACTN|nr:hypothetical protein [Actinocrinis puniceicyclus]MBS2964718.1 hypothetical protein [Actinocrinis puniceicyclus]
MPDAIRGRRAARAAGLAVGSALAADGAGVLLLAAADARSRSGASGGYPLFWAGLALIFAPSAGVLLLSRRGRAARLAVALGFGLALYLAKVVYEPTAFTFHDEFAHYRNAANLLSSGRLFGYNPLIRATGYYPGLAVATDALARLTGLSVYTSGLILIGCARLTLVGALYLLVDELLGSARAAGVAVLVYAAGPNFLYWDAQYGYESLALPLAVLALFFLARRGGRAPGAPALLCALAAGLAVVATHHITAWVLAVLLAAWAAAVRSRRRQSSDVASTEPDAAPGTAAAAQYAPTLPATVTTGTAVAWLLAVAPITLGYIGPVVARAAVQGFQLIVELHTSRTLFANTGQAATAPAWERVAAVAGTLVILAALPVTLYRGRRTGLPVIVKLLTWSSLAWVALLPLRFTAGGQETANRSSEFLYVGIAVCFALLLEPLLASSRWRRVSALGIVAVLFVGGVSVSWNYSQRLASDYRLTNGSALVTPDDRALAQWMLATLGPGHRVATDDQTGLALGSLGRQDVLASAEDGSRTWLIFYPPSVTGDVLAEIRRSAVEYVVVQRDVLDLPTGVTRFDDSEPAQYYDSPLPAASLSKFDSSPLFREIYAAGSVRLYQVVASARGR